jgi:hypothetical protein
LALEMIHVGDDAPAVHWIEAFVLAVRGVATDGSRPGPNRIRLGGGIR